jgi:hypothetical protein
VYVECIKPMTEIWHRNHSSFPCGELIHKPRPPNELGVKNHKWRAQPPSMGAVKFPAQARFQLIQATQVVSVIKYTMVACAKQVLHQGGICPGLGTIPHPVRHDLAFVVLKAIGIASGEGFNSAFTTHVEHFGSSSILRQHPASRH